MKNILLTGISRGLGVDIAKMLLESGYAVYGISRSTSDQLAELRQTYPDTLFFQSYDLADTQDIKSKLVSGFLKMETPIWGYINNAALAYDDIITNLNYGRLEKMYKVNVFSPMILVKEVIRNMLLHRTPGSIIHISSISAHTGYKGLAMYASTKGALEAFSKNTAREWGEKGIRSNCIVAGFMETDMSAGLAPEQKERILRRTSLKKLTDTQSVASMIKLLLSEEANSITGQNIFIDSGTI